MSLYKSYLEETTTEKVYETKDWFFSYLIYENVFMITNMFVRPGKRKGKAGMVMKDKIFEYANKYGCTVTSGEINVLNPNYSSIIPFLEKNGWQVVETNNNKTLVCKEI